MNEADLRVLRTRHALKMAFVTLVIENGFESVTIRDVTNRAKVGYRTFFRHYQNRQDLLSDALHEVIEEFKAVMLPPKSVEITEINVIKAFQLVEKHADLFRVLFRAPNYQEVIKPFIDYGRKAGRYAFGQSHIPTEVIDTHFVYALMNLQRWWLEQGMAIPATTMAQYVHALIIQPILTLSQPTLTTAAPLQNPIS